MTRTRPTPSKVAVCTHRRKDGQPCKTPPLPGKTCCVFHNADHKPVQPRTRVKGHLTVAPPPRPEAELHPDVQFRLRIELASPAERARLFANARRRLWSDDPDE